MYSSVKLFSLQILPRYSRKMHVTQKILTKLEILNPPTKKKSLTDLPESQYDVYYNAVEPCTDYNT